MRWKVGIFALALCIAGFIGGYALGGSERREEETQAIAAENKEPISSAMPAAVKTFPVQTEASTSVIQENEETDAGYLLTLSEEKICLYKMLSNGKTELLSKTDVDTRHLRREDYEALCQGMWIDTEEEARARMEDFGG